MKSVFFFLAFAIVAASFSMVNWFSEHHDDSPSITSNEQEKGINDAGPKSEYFKEWYYPYESWPAEKHFSAIEELRKLPADDVIMIKDRKGRFIPASHQPWVQKGPIGIIHNGYDPPQFWSGRVISLGSHPSIGLFVGAADGGLWKPYGSGFIPVSDNLSSLAIGGIAVKPDNPETYFIGTGEYPGGSLGTGVYRSADGGMSWTQLSLIPTPTRVSKMLIPLWETNVVFAATDSGIYRSTDSGDSWARVQAGSASDIASSSTGNFMLAGMRWDGVYRSTDFGASWVKLTADLPATDSTIGRISVAIAPSDSLRGYAQIGYPKPIDSVRAVLKTTNAGGNWSNVTPPPSALSGGKTKYLAQEWYNNVLTVHPANPDIVWAGGVLLLRSSNGGSSWDDVGATGESPRPVHPDIHVLLYRDAQTLVVGCDGGIFTTSDEGLTWSNELNQFLPITQFYNSDIEHEGGRTKTGGTQDNGLLATTVDEPEKWVLYSGGDGIDAVVNQVRPTMTFGTNNSSKGFPRRVRTDNSLASVSAAGNGINPYDIQQTFWKTYLAVDPISARTVFTNAGNYVYWSLDSGNNWARMNSAPFNKIAGKMTVNRLGTVVYAPTKDTSQRLMRFHWAFAQWSLTNKSAGLPQDRQVKRVHPSTRFLNWAYAVINGIGSSEKVFKTTDAGDTWTNITSNLPDVPVNDVVDDYDNTDILYCGTDKGAFRSSDAGGNWQRWNAGMPEAVRIMDMEYVFDSTGNYIFAGTYGRSTFERLVGGNDPLLVLSKVGFNFGSVLDSVAVRDSFVVRNEGNAQLEIDSIFCRNPYLTLSPSRASVAAGESLLIRIVFTPPRIGPREFRAAIELRHNGDGSPSQLFVTAFLGDGTFYRTFLAESLIVKKEVKRKTTSTSWCFRFDNSETHREGANALYVEFKNPAIDVSSPAFASAVNLDGRGKKWRFTDGTIPAGGTAVICGRSARTKPQQVLRWWWSADLVQWDDDVEHTEEGILGSVQGGHLPYVQGPGMDMPNAANLRSEVFQQYPVTRESPFIIGVADPDPKGNKVAYVAFAKHADLYNSLTAGRSGKRHTGPPRCFNFLDNGKEMTGKFRKLTPEMQDNKLFAELVALKLNIYASALGKTPAGFGELRYLDTASRLNNFLVREIDSLAGRYMTYCDSSAVGSGAELYEAVLHIDSAFAGRIDTVSFAGKLAFTGVRPVAEVPYLVRDPSVAATYVEPRASAYDELPEKFELHQNYPNPFNPTTMIGFQLPVSSMVTLKVYDILGREVATLLDRQMMDEGENEAAFNAHGASSGVYFYRLSAQPIVTEDDEEGVRQSYTSIKKMLLMK